MFRALELNNRNKDRIPDFKVHITNISFYIIIKKILN